MAVVRSRLDGEILDLLRGHCHAGGNVVHLREDEGPQGAQGEDGGGGDGLYRRYLLETQCRWSIRTSF